MPESDLAKTLREAEVEGVPMERLEVTTCMRKGEIEIVTRYGLDDRDAYAQLDAVIRMLEEEQDCRAVMTQLAAASKAVDRAGFTLVATGMRHCLVEEDREDATGADDGADDPNRLTLAQMEKLFLTLT